MMRGGGCVWGVDCGREGGFFFVFTSGHGEYGRGSAWKAGTEKGRREGGGCEALCYLSEQSSAPQRTAPTSAERARMQKYKFSLPLYPSVSSQRPADPSQMHPCPPASTCICISAFETEPSFVSICLPPSLLYYL